MQLYWDCFSAKVSNLNDELHVSVFHLKLVIITSLHWWGLTRHNYEELIIMQFTLNSVLPFRNREPDSRETLDFEVCITEHGDWHWFHSSAQYQFSLVIDKWIPNLMCYLLFLQVAYGSQSGFQAYSQNKAAGFAHLTRFLKYTLLKCVSHVFFF